jgi:protein TonB
MMEKDEKVGVWEYYSYAADGEQILAQKYDHSTNKLLFFRPDGKEYLAEVAPGVWEKTSLTQPPWCVGGYEALAGYMAKLNYPAQAQNRNVQGKVVVSFWWTP